MEIMCNNNVNKVPFNELKEGGVFKYNEILFMKIATPSISFNAVRLDDGRCTDFINEYVEPVKEKFIMD